MCVYNYIFGVYTYISHELLIDKKSKVRVKLSQRGKRTYLNWNGLWQSYTYINNKYEIHCDNISRLLDIIVLSFIR